MATPGQEPALYQAVEQVGGRQRGRHARRKGDEASRTVADDTGGMEGAAQAEANGPVYQVQAIAPLAAPCQRPTQRLLAKPVVQRMKDHQDQRERQSDSD